MFCEVRSSNLKLRWRYWSFILYDRALYVKVFSNVDSPFAVLANACCVNLLYPPPQTTKNEELVHPCKSLLYKNSWTQLNVRKQSKIKSREDILQFHIQWMLILFITYLAVGKNSLLICVWEVFQFLEQNSGNFLLRWILWTFASNCW